MGNESDRRSPVVVGLLFWGGAESYPRSKGHWLGTSYATPTWGSTGNQGLCSVQVPIHGTNLLLFAKSMESPSKSVVSCGCTHAWSPPVIFCLLSKIRRAACMPPACRLQRTWWIGLVLSFYRWRTYFIHCNYLKSICNRIRTMQNITRFPFTSVINKLLEWSLFFSNPKFWNLRDRARFEWGSPFSWASQSLRDDQASKIRLKAISPAQKLLQWIKIHFIQLNHCEIW
jgi:hypothetical protein